METSFTPKKDVRPEPQTLEDYLADIRKRLGRIEMHLIALKQAKQV